ncbi:MAG: hypothetical protein U0802_05580 [Candidatus Binatia bacterium]
MRGIARHRVGLVAALLLLGALLGGCGNDSPCNHVIQDVARFEDCQAIAVERRCSDQVTYSNKNQRCKVENCGDCNGPLPTPTAVPTS